MSNSIPEIDNLLRLLRNKPDEPITVSRALDFCFPRTKMYSRDSREKFIKEFRRSIHAHPDLHLATDTISLSTKLPEFVTLPNGQRFKAITAKELASLMEKDMLNGDDILYIRRLR